VSLTLLLVLLAAPQTVGAPPGAAAPGEERPAEPSALDRDPASLPRAEPGAWDGFFAGDRPDPARVEALGAATRALLGSADAAYRERRYVQAVELLHAALGSEPDLPAAWLALGNTYFRLRRHGHSRTALERFLAHAPDQVFRTQALGHDLYTLGEYPAALAHYGRVREAQLERGVLSTEVTRGIALTHMRMGELEVALDGLGGILALDPENFDARLWRARILFDLERLEEALEEARAAQALAAHDPRPLRVVADALFELGRDEEAEAVLERWRELDALAQDIRSLEAELLFAPDDWGRTLELARLRAAAGDGRGSIEAVRRAAALAPAEVGEVQVLLRGLEQLARGPDLDAASRFAGALEDEYPDSLRVWIALEEFWRAAGSEERAERARARWRLLVPAPR
jgi:tetratricopeptide (TPR) repeat protein